MKMSAKIENQKNLLVVLADSQSHKLYNAIVKNAPPEFVQAVKEIFYNIRELQISSQKARFFIWILPENVTAHTPRKEKTKSWQKGLCS